MENQKSGEEQKQAPSLRRSFYGKLAKFET
jgi:hypothetical protein